MEGIGARHPPSALVCSPTWKLSKPHCVGFYGGSIMWAELITLVTNSTSSPSPHPGDQGTGRKCQPPAASNDPRGFQKLLH